MQEENKKKAIQIKSAFGYTNEDNPYGDNKLEEPFIWKKKLEMSEDFYKDMEKEQDNNKIIKQIELVKKRRMEREMEKQKNEDERGDYIKEREDTNYQEWKQKEVNFHKEQDKNRSNMRINQKRLMMVDYFNLCVKYYQSITKPVNEEQQEILATVNSKLIKEYMSQFKVKIEQDKQLAENIKEAEILVQSEEQQEYQNYWKSIILLMKHQQDIQQGNLILNEYQSEIENIINNKTISELDQIESQILNNIINDNPQFQVDKQYWQQMLYYLNLQRANTLLLDYYQVYNQYNTNKKFINSKANLINQKNIQNSNVNQNNREGQFSPILLEFTQEMLQKSITQEFQIESLKESRENIFKNNLQQILDRVKSQQKRIQLIKAQNKKEDMDEYIDRNRRDFQENEISQEITDFLTMEQTFKNEDEEQFQDEIDLQESYNWVLQYKPRKPKYLNKVKTCFDWSKYNQTHYDEDNPPPKVIIGYKFNVFYPDLINKRDIPQYLLEPCENKDYCLIRFKAGPPYEDIAFKILNREWNLTDKYGFRCQFERGILQLYFNFRKFKYRN